MSVFECMYSYPIQKKANNYTLQIVKLFHLESFPVVGGKHVDRYGGLTLPK